MTKVTARSDSAATGISAATVNGSLFSTVNGSKTLFDAPQPMVAGCLNDSELVRAAIAESIRKCNKSRVQIAEEISFLSGQNVTAISLNKFTAASRKDFRWPAELDRAFCVATGNDSLLKCRAEAAGYRLIRDEEIYLLELGRQFLKRKRADAEVEMLERRLAQSGVAE